MSGNDRKTTSPGEKRLTNREALRPHLPKRFYRDVTVEARDGQWFVLLDGREIKTPGKTRLSVPTETIAKVLAEEWDDQETVIDPGTMPATRIANSAIERVSDSLQAVADDIVTYAGSDLLCYRADTPEALVKRQAEAWDPVLAWVQSDIGARFVLGEGVMPVKQPSEALREFGSALKPLDAFQLAGLHVVTTLTGSAILALSILKRHMSAAEAWMSAHIDEDFQIEQWGEDDEAMTRRAIRWLEMKAACAFLEPR